MSSPVEPKVKAGSLGAAIAGIADWLLAKYLFPHLPDPTAQALILGAVPAVLAFAGGWLARHQQRPEAMPPPAAPSNVTVTPKGAP